MGLPTRALNVHVLCMKCLVPTNCLLSCPLFPSSCRCVFEPRTQDEHHSEAPSLAGTALRACERLESLNFGLVPDPDSFINRCVPYLVPSHACGYRTQGCFAAHEPKCTAETRNQSSLLGSIPGIRPLFNAGYRWNGGKRPVCKKQFSIFRETC